MNESHAPHSQDPRSDGRLADALRRTLEVAAEGHYDIMVMGTHGRVGRLDVLVGSVTVGVVKNAPCPVLCLRAKKEESFDERIHRIPSLAEQLPTAERGGESGGG